MKRFAIALVIALLPSAVTASRNVVQAAPGGGHFSAVCGLPAPHSMRCNADVATSASGGPVSVPSSPIPGSYGPSQFHGAYNLPTAAPSGQTIGIVVAYHDPNLAADLATYSQQFGLSPCTVSSGCLTIKTLSSYCGGNSKIDRQFCTPNQGWALEESMDVEVAHAICQNCKLVVVEGAYADMADLGTAENTAVQSGATVVSNSWGQGECYCETQYDAYWSHPGVAIVFSSGDSGSTVEYPSASPYVISAGGTTLTVGANNSYGGETAWNGAGSGCSVVEPAQGWQTAVTNWSQTGCGSYRATGDVAADADPNTGAAVYDSVGYNGQTGWFKVGGTSLAAPIVSGSVALAGGTASYANADQVPYLKMNAANSHDVTSGVNGSCSTAMCAAGSGYDGPTGLGTPNGVGGL